MEKLANLSVYLSNPRISLNEKLLKICMTVKSAIPNCDRVGIWLFFVEHTEMVSLMCVDELGRKSNGEQLLASDYQDYFAHIIEHEFLVASDARNNDIAKCFNQGYFDVHNIHSLLDVTFKKDYIPLGIICCERTASKIDWQILCCIRLTITSIVPAINSATTTSCAAIAANISGAFMSVAISESL